MATTVSLNGYTYTLNSDYTMSAEYSGTVDSDGAVPGLLGEILYNGDIYTLTSIEGCFEYTSIKYPPVIPDTVENMKYAFFGCIGLLYPPAIPHGVKNMHGCFRDCTSMDTNGFPLLIPDSVTNLQYCFYNCSSLSIMPSLPINFDATRSTTLNLNQCFLGCTSLVDATGCPNVGVDLTSCFSGCTALKYGPEYPKDGSTFTYMYNGCTSLIYPNSSTGSSGKLNLKALLLKLINQCGNAPNRYYHAAHAWQNNATDSPISSYAFVDNCLFIGPRNVDFTFDKMTNYSDSSAVSDLNGGCGELCEMNSSGFCFAYLHTQKYISSVTYSGNNGNGSSTFQNADAEPFMFSNVGVYTPSSFFGNVDVWNKGVIKGGRTGVNGTYDLPLSGYIATSSGYPHHYLRIWRSFNSTSTSTVSNYKTHIVSTWLGEIRSIDPTYAVGRYD